MYNVQLRPLYLFLKKSLAAAAWMAVFGLCMCSPAPLRAADGGIWNDPEISTAVDKARRGQTEDIMRLTSRAKPKSSWKPVKKNLPQYHECLGTNENPLVHFFAVAAVSRFKDKSSVVPLQNFVMTAQRRVQGGTLPREEAAMLQLAVGAAVETLGEIDGDNDLSVAFLGTLLKHDIPKEWGGAVAHSALSKKGLPGLRRLLEESLTAEGNQVSYVGSAIHEISDPALVGALYAACLDPKYSVSAGGAALGAIAGMRATAPEAEQLVSDILMRDEKSDLRLSAARCVAGFGTEKGFKLLRDLRNAPGKGGDQLVQYIDDALLENDTEHALDGVVKNILSPATPDAEKMRLCYRVAGLGKDKIIRHAATLATCLNVANAKGEPLNEARVTVWLTLHEYTKVKHPLTLAYENDQRFELETFGIRKALRDEYRKENRYPYQQHAKMAEDATKQMITKWVKDGKTEKKENVK